MKSVKDLWKAYEEQLRRDDPEEYRKLNGPISAQELKKLDAILPQGARLPNDYMELLRSHNGSSLDDPVDFNGYNFLSMDGILQAYSYMQDRANKFDEQYGTNGPKPHATHGVQQVFNNPAWIPVLAASDWKNFICLDFDPASGGSKGQVIDVHFRAGPVGNVFKNFSEFFNELMEEILEEPLSEEELRTRLASQAVERTQKETEAKPKKTSIWSRIFARESLSQEAVDISTQTFKPSYLKW